MRDPHLSDFSVSLFLCLLPYAAVVLFFTAFAFKVFMSFKDVMKEATLRYERVRQTPPETLKLLIINHFRARRVNTNIYNTAKRSEDFHKKLILARPRA